MKRNVRLLSDLRPGMKIRVRDAVGRRSNKYLVVEIPFNTDGYIIVKPFRRFARKPDEKQVSLCVAGMGVRIKDLTPVPSTPKERWRTVVVS